MNWQIKNPGISVDKKNLTLEMNGNEIKKLAMNDTTEHFTHQPP